MSWLDAFRLEMEVARIIREQEETGVFFDLGRAHYYISHLTELMDECYLEVRPYLEYDIQIKEALCSETGEYSYVKKIRNKDGSYSAPVLRWYGEDCDSVGGEFSRITIEEPSMSKRARIIDQLLKHGWKPTKFTDKGFPKLTVDGEPVETLSKVGEFGQALTKWYVYSHRKSQIQGFINNVRADGRISACMDTCATNTFRAAHRVVANIARPSSLFGKEMRSLFGVGEGRSFVGADASGLELRMLAHRMNDPEYTHQILSGDIHTYNQIKAGLPTRDNAKTFIYGFLYGAGPSKIGAIVGKGAAEGKKLQSTFLSEIPALSNLINKVRDYAEKNKFIPAIDGRKIRIRSFEGRVLTHTALNALLQADGSIVVKRAMVIAYQEIKRRKLDANQIIFYHDELAYDSHSSCAEEVGQILADSMRLSGEYYKLKVPIAGEYKIGKDWSIH